MSKYQWVFGLVAVAALVVSTAAYMKASNAHLFALQGMQADAAPIKLPQTNQDKCIKSGGIWTSNSSDFDPIFGNCAILPPTGKKAQ